MSLNDKDSFFRPRSSWHCCSYMSPEPIILTFLCILYDVINGKLWRNLNGFVLKFFSTLTKTIIWRNVRTAILIARRVRSKSGVSNPMQFRTFSWVRTKNEPQRIPIRRRLIKNKCRHNDLPFKAYFHSLVFVTVLTSAQKLFQRFLP